MEIDINNSRNWKRNLIHYQDVLREADARTTLHQWLVEKTIVVSRVAEVIVARAAISQVDARRSAIVKRVRKDEEGEWLFQRFEIDAVVDRFCGKDVCAASLQAACNGLAQSYLCKGPTCATETEFLRTRAPLMADERVRWEGAVRSLCRRAHLLCPRQFELDIAAETVRAKNMYPWSLFKHLHLWARRPRGDQ